MSGRYSTVEPAPYEIPLQTMCRGSVPMTNKTSFIPQDRSAPVLYEEPDRYTAPPVPSDYEVAVIQGTNQSSLDTYSSVENASREAHTSPNEYSSPHFLNLDREQHIYTPPLQQSSSPQQQEHTYFTLEQGVKGGGGGGGGGGGEGGGVQQRSETMPQEHTYFMLKNGEEAGEEGGEGRGRGVSSSDVDYGAQPQDHVYFTLDKTREGGTQSVKKEGERMDTPL